MTDLLFIKAVAALPGVHTTVSGTTVASLSVASYSSTFFLANFDSADFRNSKSAFLASISVSYQMPDLFRYPLLWFEYSLFIT